MVDENHIANLRALGDEGFILSSNDALDRYQTAARHGGGRASFVLRPRTTQEVSSAVAYCVKHGLKLVPQSANTGLVGGSVPDPSGTQGVLSLERLKGQPEISLANRSVRVGAGVRLSDLNAQLEDHGLFFPIDLGADPMIGGMAATNTGGARFIRYGDVRRNILGLTVVLPDRHGTVLKLGSGVRKNNSGLDWKHIFIGSCGSLGVITECVLNVEPCPKQTATALIVPANDTAIDTLLMALEQRLGPMLSAFESMSGNAIRYALDHVPSLRNPFPHLDDMPELVLLVEVSQYHDFSMEGGSLTEVLEKCLADVWEMPERPIGEALIGSTADFWALRHSLSEGLRATGGLIALDLAFERQAIVPFRRRIAALLATQFPTVELCDFGHVGDGGIHLNLVYKPSDTEKCSVAETDLRSWIVEIAVTEFGGSFSAEHGVGPKNQPYYDRYTPDEIKLLTTSAKQAWSWAPIGRTSFEGST